MITSKKMLARDKKTFVPLMTGPSIFCMMRKNVWTKASIRENLLCKLPLVDAFFRTQE